MTKREIKNSLKEQCGSNSRFCRTDISFKTIYKMFKLALKAHRYNMNQVSDIGINRGNLYIIILSKYMLVIDLFIYRR